MRLPKTSIPFFLLIILSTSTCNKKDELPPVPGYLKRLLPYKNGQVVHFSNGVGHTIAVKADVASGIHSEVACLNCEPELYTGMIHVSLRDVTVNKSLASLSVNTRPFVSVTIYSPLHDYTNGNDFTMQATTDATQLPCNVRQQTCQDEVTLNGKKFSQVTVVSGYSPNNDQVDKSFYTVQKGLVGFMYRDGRTFNLVE
jgi:hypothetical protein